MAAAIQNLQFVANQPRSVKEPRIQTPSVVVLLGSTSALASLELMQQMLSLTTTDFKRVALVYIDTDNIPNSLVEFRQLHSGKFQEFTVRIGVPVGIGNFTKLDQPSGVLRDNYTEQHTFIKSRMPQYFTTGAGGIRNNGHVAACANYDLLYDTLERAVMTVTQIDDQYNKVVAKEVHFNIVAFLGGGTGSGILPDIAVMSRQILADKQLEQRLNLFCILPEAIQGVTSNDLSWRKSNATACLLELMALSLAAGGKQIGMDNDDIQTGTYRKLMRENFSDLTNNPIANEVYLIGKTSLSDAGETARVVGLDLFQRITDASGVGYLEHSKYVDRLSLSGQDDRRLPTMFGSSCPLEIRFPAQETATAFAKISAARLLPLLAAYSNKPFVASEAEKNAWVAEWRGVARLDATQHDPMAVKPPAEFNPERFMQAEKSRLDMIWAELERTEKSVEDQILRVVARKREEELRQIHQPQGIDNDASSLLHGRLYHLQRLLEEYTAALADLTIRRPPTAELRPNTLEATLTSPGFMERFRLNAIATNVCLEYNKILVNRVKAARYWNVKKLLEELVQVVKDALAAAEEWIKNAEVEKGAAQLEQAALASMAWRGVLEHPHPYQRHIFDLDTLRTIDGRNRAVELLYEKVTGIKDMYEPQSLREYTRFVNDCVKELEKSNMQTFAGVGGGGSLDVLNPARLNVRVEKYFYDFYMNEFRDTNLLELLEKGSPAAVQGQQRQDLISGYLSQHLDNILGLMTDMVTFEPQLWSKGASALNTSLYLGMHWRGGEQRALLQGALQRVVAAARSQAPMVNPMIDPHRLQISYGKHAISLSTVRDFYQSQSSAMAEYIYYQNEWRQTGGIGTMPVHASGEMERLVWEPDALGFKDRNGQDVMLVSRVLRQSRTQQPTRQAPQRSQPSQGNYQNAYQGQGPQQGGYQGQGPQQGRYQGQGPQQGGYQGSQQGGYQTPQQGTQWDDPQQGQQGSQWDSTQEGTQWDGTQRGGIL